MKRLICVLCLFLGILMARAQDFAALDGKMEDYFKAIEASSVANKCKEADFLVSSCTEAAVREHVAQYVFSHYAGSPVMGDEGVAVHVAKKWMGDNPEAKAYVLFNEKSLLGARASVLTLQDHNAQKVSLFTAPGEKYTLLYFYDTSCTSCAATSTFLMQYLPTAPLPMDVVAVYVGRDEAAWSRYRTLRFNLPGALHLWDPQMESSFQTDYGVLKTPMIYLIDPELKIVGRRLDIQSLPELMGTLSDSGTYQYGSRESMAFFDALFAEDPTSEDVLEVARYIETKTLGDDNPAGYARSMGDMLYYLSFRKSEAFREAMTPFLDEFIYGKPVWSAEDSLQVLTLADMMTGLLSKCPVGSKVPDVKVTGTLRRPGKADKEVTKRLRRLRGRPGVVVFASDSCAACQDTAPLLDSLLADAPRRLKVFIVKADDTLLDDFDLSSLPYIIMLDKKGIVTRRYVDL